jgi:phenylalanyl-tRNA synthetase alpha chain
MVLPNPDWVELSLSGFFKPEYGALRDQIACSGSLPALASHLPEIEGVRANLRRELFETPKDQKKEIGVFVNGLTREFEQAYEERKRALLQADLVRELAASDFDPTEPGRTKARGALHPITIVQNELVDLFTSMGFQWQDGPEVESEYFNFDALNIPGDHPARESQDTFWLEEHPGLGKNLLRTHTSPVQVRTMQRLSKPRFHPPLKVIVPGRCFRSETVDKSHEHTFYQMEGLVVDRGISTANLIHTMKTCLRVILERDVQVRLRPGFFPFVEPGFELDVNCPFCKGQGCSVCKQSGWIEILPCGMVHPNVLRQGGIDPEEYTGFAFGMGLQRVVMLRYGIDDIRQFMGGDLRFLQQFPEVPR